MSVGEPAHRIRDAAPGSVLAAITTPEGPGVLYDALFDDDTCAALLGVIQNRRELRARRGLIRGMSGGGQLVPESVVVPGSIRRSSAEQSNSSILYDEHSIMKLFRRFQGGPNPDCEIGKYLTDQAHFDWIPPFLGSFDYV